MLGALYMGTVYFSRYIDIYHNDDITERSQNERSGSDMAKMRPLPERRSGFNSTTDEICRCNDARKWNEDQRSYIYYKDEARQSSCCTQKLTGRSPLFR